MSYRRPFLTPSDRLAIISAYQSGEKTEAIAAEHGCTVSTVAKIARKAGCPPRPNRRRTSHDRPIAN
jgi:transposase-like protein